MNRTADHPPRRRLSYSNVTSTLAVFVALSGTAIAANTIGTDDIIDNEVRSRDVRNDTLDNGGLNAVDLRRGSVGAGEVVDASVGGAKVADGSLGGADIASGALTGLDFNNLSLKGADIDEASLTQVPSALLGGFGRTGGENGCDPSSTTFVDCAATPALTVPPGARALIIARARARQLEDGGTGKCGFARSTALGLLPNTTVTFAVNGEHDQHERGSLVALSPPQLSGPVSYELRCNEVTGNLFFDDAAVTALLISSS